MFNNSELFPHYSNDTEFRCKPDCRNRRPGCQDHCETYLSVAEARKPYLDEAAKLRTVEDYISDHDYNQKKRFKKH